MQRAALPRLLSRIALAACFLGFGIWEIVAPRLWTSYLPSFLAGFHPIFFVEVHGIVLTMVAIGVLTGYAQRFFTGLAALLLLNICIELFLQEGFTDTFIRDASLFLFALALHAEAYAHHR